MSEGPPGDPHAVAVRAAERAARTSYGKLLAILAARFRDLDAAEDALGDALVSALASWPEQGVPRSPEAWLLQAARRRLLNRVRHAGVEAAAEARIRHELEDLLAPGGDEQELPDRRLALLFACAHPAIEPEARTALVLQAVLGLRADRIAAAFLVTPSAMAQRLVRTKRKIREAGIPFRVPGPAELPERLETVLDAVYAAYASGWLAGEGEGPEALLADEALWLARLLAELAAEEPEALGLLALLLHVHARRDARRGQGGEFVALSDQDASRWHADEIAEAEGLLRRAARLGRIGRFQLEAAVQSVHAARLRTGATDWAAILQLYDALAAHTGSPVVALNRAVALAHARGAAAGLAALEALAGDGRLDDYQPWHAARADLLNLAGHREEALAAYARAIALAPLPALKRFLERRRDALGTA